MLGYKKRAMNILSKLQKSFKQFLLQPEAESIDFHFYASKRLALFKKIFLYKDFYLLGMFVMLTLG